MNLFRGGLGDGDVLDTGGFQGGDKDIDLGLVLERAGGEDYGSSLNALDQILVGMLVDRGDGLL